jgi:hypothetical protein
VRARLSDEGRNVVRLASFFTFRNRPQGNCQGEIWLRAIFGPKLLLWPPPSLIFWPGTDHHNHNKLLPTLASLPEHFLTPFVVLHSVITIL